MRIAIGSDHAGFALKEMLKKELAAGGHPVVDVGTSSEASCDYPDFAAAVARSVARKECERGILVCGTGIGMSMAANRTAGVRAAVCHGEYAAEMSRRHNDANVLCLGSRILTADLARRIVNLWLATPFEGGRHEGRVRKIDASTPTG